MDKFHPETTTTKTMTEHHTTLAALATELRTASAVVEALNSRWRDTHNNPLVGDPDHALTRAARHIEAAGAMVRNPTQ